MKATKPEKLEELCGILKTNKTNIVWLKQTCIACPSQWEGKLSDGRMVYIRYRWGHLSIRISEKPTDDIMEAVDGKLLLEKDVSENPFDGYMDWFTMMNYLKEALKKLNKTKSN